MKTTTEHAVLIALCLASYGGMRSAKDIAAFTGIPAASVAQAASKLRQAGLIDSIRGHAGGYCLPGSAENASLFDIVTAMEGRRDAVACVRPEDPPSRRKLVSDPVSRRGAERLDSAVRALALVDLRMDEILREATLERLMLGRDGPTASDDFSVPAAMLGSRDACVTNTLGPSKGKESGYGASND
ncbi:RrF2 family transcriptional regulator [Eggerthella timonensis]|uniref:RrF2 family transcriptional regulator n=1 Tax=Eggerthella timonensis TaxID=1871008 RepID=UPI000C779871|nr:Rrf2 family transcriptional regulator [Eggerthella timonensis]